MSAFIWGQTGAPGTETSCRSGGVGVWGDKPHVGACSISCRVLGAAPSPVADLVLFFFHQCPFVADGGHLLVICLEAQT